ncbi:MAG: MBL fold metallo-hydrolase [Candidatus Levybacteria bacterium]|nr:MBL fold metallo-hydrolase [Candidatus Levybacteria bacterium]
MIHSRKLKIFLIASGLLFLLGCILIYQNITYNDKKLHITFCNAGQGDAIFVRTPQGSDILIDSGPDNAVLNCLGQHMPFWDKTLELVILTHPHADHFTGFFSVLKNYKVKSFVLEELGNKTIGFNSLTEEIKARKIPQKFIFAGDRFVLKDGVMLEIVGPTQEFIRQTSPGGTIGEGAEFASVETLIKYGKFSALLTGDSQAAELEEMLKLIQHDNLSILQVPHHGSRFGLTAGILDSLSPKLAVISVGKNKFGHPTQFILDLLKSAGIKTLRTDQNGEVEIISDGKIFKIQ